jgi:group I intron endonuclease
MILEVNEINKCIVRRYRTMAIIYKITNNINGKVYIGKAKTNNHRYYGSGLKITAAIKKYGKSNFTKTILEECDERFAGEREKYWISKLNSTNDSVGYNISLGGEGGAHYWASLTEEQRILHNKKISISKKGKSHASHSQETKNKMSLSFNRDPKIIESRAAKKRKQYICVNHKTREVFFTNNLRKFCENNNLKYANMTYNARTKKTYTENYWSCRVKNFSRSNENILRIIEEEIRKSQEIIKQTIGKYDKRGSKNPMFGKKHSELTINKIKKAYEQNRKNSN